MADQRLGITLVGRPGEIVHVALDETVGDLAVALDGAARLFAGGAYRVALGHGEADIVFAEVGEELAVRMELVRVPARRGGAALAREFQHADLGEPLRHQVEAAVVTRSEEHTSELQSLMRISYAVICLKKKKMNNKSYKT